MHGAGLRSRSIVSCDCARRLASGSGEGDNIMAVEMFLKLAGIDGESTDSKHKGEIDVLAWSWGLSNEAAPPAGGGAGAGRAKVENISIQKLVDIASPLLLLFSAQGKHISDGTLTTRKASKGAKGNEFLLFKMTDVIVTSVHVAASQDTNQPAESITLSFGKVEFDYRPDGSPGTEISFRWDVTANKKF
jgi:type VI secretion system secreted protein Hcp